MNTGRRFFAFVVASFILLSLVFSSCTASLNVKATDFTQEISPSPAKTMQPDDRFIRSMNDFSVKLLQQSASDNTNCLISPLSAALALSMTANGASGNTAAEFEHILGDTITQEERNGYLRGLTDSLKESQNTHLHIANSIWLRQDEKTEITFKSEFLQRNVDYFDAAVYGSPFDAQTVKDANRWVSYHTDQMIPKILNDPVELENSVMLLINAMSFEGQWDEIYLKSQIGDGIFTAADGTKQEVKMMRSTEWGYLEDSFATGFLKPYQGQYSFVALLPKENITLSDYIASLTGEAFAEILNNREMIEVAASLPKFSYDYDFSLKQCLQNMGMAEAFIPDVADFSKMADPSDELYLSDAIQKTQITVDEKGTKAGAVTKISIDNKSAAPAETKTVILDRPFVYAVIDNETSLPLFLGAVSEIPDAK